MINLLMFGCNGQMGRVISGLTEGMEDVRIAAGVDAVVHGNEGYPAFTSLDDCDIPVDVIVDFSAAPAVRGVLEYAVKKGLPLVECTTGLDDSLLDFLEECSKEIPILRSANMSLGVNILLKLTGIAARVLGEAGFDMDIVEKHHRRKLDAPSGTAIALADAIKAEWDDSYEYVYDRTGRRMQRPAKEIGISAVRGGTIVGEHEVIFAGTDEVVELKHTAYSRAIFGKGAISAARFLAGQPAGLYSMKDVIG